MSPTHRRALSAVALAAATLLASTLIVPTAATASTSSTPTVNRLSGASRIETAVAVSKAEYSAAPVAFVASSANYPDALSAAPVAHLAGAPLLLSAQDRVDSAVIAEAQRLRVKDVVIVGGRGVISEAAATALAKVGTVTRLAGDDRYSTSAAISQHAFPDVVDTAFLASGEGFADALSAAPIAASRKAPVLLTRGSVLPDATRTELRRLAPQRVVIAGGTGAVAAAVEIAVKRQLPGATIVRVGGKDRYETSALMAKRYSEPGTARTFVANGLNFPDALAAAPAAARAGVPVLLTAPSAVPASVLTVVHRLGSPRVTVVGGPGDIHASVVNTMKEKRPSTRALELVNKTRAALGKAPLREDLHMNAVAQDWAEEMVRTGYRHNPNFAEQIPGGWYTASENIGYMSSTTPPIAQLHAVWVNSPGHYANMTADGASAFGYGLTYENDRTSGRIYYGVQLFGSYVD